MNQSINPEDAIKTLLAILKCQTLETNELYKKLFGSLGIAEADFNAWTEALKKSQVPKVSEEKLEEIKQNMIRYARGVKPTNDAHGYTIQLCEAAGFDRIQANAIIDLTVRLFYFLEKEENTKKYIF